MSADRRPSFLSLVPTWQRPYVNSSEGTIQQLLSRRESVSSDWSSVSSLSSLSTDYGVNGFLVLTSEPNTDTPEEDE